MSQHQQIQVTMNQKYLEENACVQLKMYTPLSSLSFHKQHSIKAFWNIWTVFVICNLEMSSSIEDNVLDGMCTQISQ